MVTEAPPQIAARSEKWEAWALRVKRSSLCGSLISLGPGSMLFGQLEVLEWATLAGSGSKNWECP